MYRTKNKLFYAPYANALHFDINKQIYTTKVECEYNLDKKGKNRMVHSREVHQKVKYISIFNRSLNIFFLESSALTFFCGTPSAD
jgi:hypothetical protein